MQSIAEFIQTPFFNWVILPILIFVARIADMSLDTLRIIMIGQGRKGIAALIGFVEVCLWLIIARQVIVHMPNFLCFFAYAGGFAMGNYVGLLIEERLAIGTQMIHIMVPAAQKQIEETLRARGYGLTIIAAQGAKGPVSVVSTVVKRSNVPKLIALVKEINPKVFYTIEDVKRVNQGVFPSDTRQGLWRYLYRRN